MSKLKEAIDEFISAAIPLAVIYDEHYEEHEMPCDYPSPDSFHIALKSLRRALSKDHVNMMTVCAYESGYEEGRKSMQDEVDELKKSLSLAESFIGEGDWSSYLSAPVVKSGT
ncbi:MAG: hypothetical protein R8M45_05045 [Ghiorsea sp.]